MNLAKELMATEERIEQYKNTKDGIKLFELEISILTAYVNILKVRMEKEGIVVKTKNDEIEETLDKLEELSRIEDKSPEVNVQINLLNSYLHLLKMRKEKPILTVKAFRF